jgi:hypothetical protein
LCAHWHCQLVPSEAKNLNQTVEQQCRSSMQGNGTWAAGYNLARYFNWTDSAKIKNTANRRKRTKTIHGTGEVPGPHLGLKLQRPPRPGRKVRRGDEPDWERCVAVGRRALPSIVKTLASCRHRHPSHYQCAAIPQLIKFYSVAQKLYESTN